MYYDEYRGKRHRRYRGRDRRRRSGGCGAIIWGFVMRVILAVVLVAALAMAILYFLPVSLLNVAPKNNDLALTPNLPANYANILLLGLDMKAEGAQRCDAIIVASVDGKKAKFTSLQRDTEVEIPGYPGIHKLNSAYSYGGPELTMRVVNQTFGLNITDYIAVDFAAMVDLVDAIGGIDLRLEEKELMWYNKYALRTYRALCRADEAKYINHLKPTDELLVDQLRAMNNMVHMDGIHATGYCRIRYVDSDYGRTNRQRKVIVAILERMKKNWMDPRMYPKLWNVITNNVKTSLSMPELISLGEKVFAAGCTENVFLNRVPGDMYVEDNGSTIKMRDPTAVRRSLYEYIYND